MYEGIVSPYEVDHSLQASESKDCLYVLGFAGWVVAFWS